MNRTVNGSFEEYAASIPRRVAGFAEEMRAQGIHVGMGRVPRCVNCGELWPCEGSKTMHSEETHA